MIGEYLIECDYQIKREEGNEIKTYTTPEEFKRLPNIVHIEGPNDAGKSTLLNIIALALFGNKNKNLNPDLKYRINGLLDSDYQKVKFRIKVDGVSSLELIVEKDNFDLSDLKIYEINNGQRHPLSYETFEKRYNLIYDIPDNPIGRLRQLILDVREAQQRYGGVINDFKVFLKQQINDVQNANNPALIERYKSEYNRLKEELESLKLEEQNKRLELLRNYYYFRAYKEIENRLSTILAAIKEAREGLRKAGYSEDGKEAGYNSLSADAVRGIKEVERDYREIIELLNNINSKEANKLREIDFKRINKDMDLPSYFDSQISKIKEIIKDAKSRIMNNKSFSQIQLYDELVDVLENYKGLEVNLPGTNLTIKKFIDSIKKEKEKMSKYTQLVNDVEEINKSMDILDDDLKWVRGSLFKLTNLKEKNKKLMQLGSDPEIIRSQIAQMEEEEKELDTEFSIIKGKYNELGSPELTDIEAIGNYRIFAKLTIEQMKKELERLEDGVKKETERKTSTEDRMKRWKEEIEKLEHKKAHKYKSNFKQLEQLFDDVDELDNLINVKFNKFIRKLIDEEALSVKNLDSEEVIYNEALSKYLARKIRFIMYIDKSYETEEINLVTGIITTKDRKQIRLKDMGTGHSQSGYLTGKLSTQDDRKIIALFDEVGMMDSTSLEQVYKKLRELYTQNKLIMGIVVQRGEKLKIISKM